MGTLRDILAAIIKSMTVRDSAVYGLAGCLVVVGKAASGIIPVIALLVGIGQLRIQYVRHKVEKLKLQNAQEEAKMAKEEHAAKMSIGHEDG